MLKRTVVGIAMVPLLLVVIFFAPEIVAALFVGLFAAIAVHELLWGTKLVTQPRLLVYTMLAAFAVPLWSYFGCELAWLAVIVLGLYILLFLEAMLSGTKLPFAQIAMCMVSGIVVPYMFSALVRILCMDDGRYYILTPFVAAFLSDVGAYFTGSFLGKHKLCPAISPKKTVEGFVGGIVAAVLGMVIYGLILQLAFDMTINYFFVIIYGLLGSVCGVFGDLSFSVIKRQTGIKDYGKIFPGHGGILDRFDSVIVVAPLMEALLILIPMAY